MGHAPWSLAETKARVRNSLRDSFPAMFGERWTEAREIFYENFGRSHLQSLSPLPDTEGALDALAGSGLYLGVVSNKSGHWLRREVEHLGWGRFFGQVVGAGDAARDKPAIAPLELALAPAGMVPGPDVWFVGDAAIDMECALNGGCIPVLIASEGLDEAWLGQWPPRHRFKNFKALMAGLPA